MPTVGRRRYPYTKAGKAAAKKATKGGAMGPGPAKAAKRAKKGAKGIGKAAGKIGRSPSQIRKMGAAMKRASNKRKAGRGYKK
jgi:hypothetical protein